MRRYFIIMFIIFLAACGGTGTGTDSSKGIEAGGGGDADTGSPPPSNSGGDGDGGSSGGSGGGGDCRTPRRGFNLACWYEGCFQVDEISDSLDAILDIGGNWLAIVPTWYQDTAASSEIFEDDSASTEDLAFVINLAKGKGFGILLKPHIDTYSGAWRGEIDPDNLAVWQESYREFIIHFAELSEDLGVDILAIGTELEERVGDTAFWRGLVTNIRDVYSGELTYAANWDNYEAVEFWDLLDYIGIDFYFPLTDDPNASQAEMEAALAEIGADLEAYSSGEERPILFTEIGYRSADGTNTRPYRYDDGAAEDLQEQADAYAAVLTTYGNEAWLEGIFWWRWDPRFEDAEDGGYFIHDKPAEEVLAGFWRETVCAQE